MYLYICPNISYKNLHLHIVLLVLYNIVRESQVTSTCTVYRTIMTMNFRVHVSILSDNIPVHNKQSNMLKKHSKSRLE